MSERPGCLGVLLRLFGIEKKEPAALPYRLGDNFLTPAELTFYRVLTTVVGDKAAICPKVNLADLFFVVRPNENMAYRNKIDRKHVDFLLCDSKTMKPLLGIELDDKSHRNAERKLRDEFVDQVFEVAGLPLLHVPVQAGYSPGELSAKLMPFLSGSLPASMPAATSASLSASAPIPAPASTPVSTQQNPEGEVGIPLCPKCGVPMVLRTASRGERQGQQFYGCPNFPKCRETRAYT